MTGDAKIGSAFSSLPFDHLFFTGSTPVGRAIMRAASENLVPVTLELGGKSPIIVEPGLSICRPPRDASPSASAPMAGRSAPRRTICLLPKDDVEEFVTAFRQEVDTLYPDIADNPDYTWILNDRHFARLTGLVEDAKAKGARVVEIGTKPGDAQSRLFRPTLLLDVTDEMAVMQEEIFGPILPVVTYDGLDDAIAYVNATAAAARALLSSAPTRNRSGRCWSGRPPAAC